MCFLDGESEDKAAFAGMDHTKNDFGFKYVSQFFMSSLCCCSSIWITFYFQKLPDELGLVLTETIVSKLFRPFFTAGLFPFQGQFLVCSK